MLFPIACLFVIPFFQFCQIENTVSFSKTEAMCRHPCMVIWDLESSMHHLQIKHKGPISCKYPYFATLIPFSHYFSFPSECTDIKQEGKVVGTDRRGGRRWTWGEAVVGPSGEATPHSLGSTPPFSFFCLNFAQKYYLKLLFFFF